MLYLTCTTITSVDLEHYGVSRAKDWLSVNCGTSHTIQISYETALLTSEFLCPLIQPDRLVNTCECYICGYKFLTEIGMTCKLM